ncbi:MAG: putative toxin-antitoxin system toxin component, PIN family [Candidatus Methylomirabilaceae bacterium]
MFRAVLDTNVFISALFGGTPEDVYRAALRGQFVLITSPAILTELAQKLREKFGLPEADITAYVKQIARRSKVVRPGIRLSVVTDAADNRVLECAVAGEADVIVSGDRHLLRLKEYSGIPVVRPVDFLRTLGPSEPKGRR